MGRATPSVFTIPAGVNFARALAEGVVQQVGRDPLALADLVLLVPTRRSARTLQEEFARSLGGAALGPRIRALGDLDEDEILFAPAQDDLDLPPAIAPLRRRLLLATLVEGWARARGEALPFAQAVSHAGELGRFLDEVTTQSADLSRLKDMAPAALAAHWQDIAGFLGILAKEWPSLLAAEGALEPASRRDEILRRYAARLLAAPPAAGVIAAGSTGSIPATAELLKLVAHLPNGAVVLPGLDRHLDEASWDALEDDPGHTQFGLRQLLNHIGVTRDEVTDWPAAPQPRERVERVDFLSEALRPPPTTDAWRDLVDQGVAPDVLDGLALVEAASQREEALVVALALRQTLESPGRTAALVTPDRRLARRVATELKRWDIAIDDSAGTLLSRTPPGAFLAVLAHAAAERFAPVPLLALLKHPLAAGGSDQATFRRRVRALEIAVLHGLRPAPGLAGIQTALQRKESWQWLRDWFAGVAQILSPFSDAMETDNAALPDLARAHAQVAEALASSREASGAKNLWRGESGEAAATLIAELMEHGRGIGLAPARNYSELLRDLAEARTVRPPYGRHPRLFILGPLEARLQQFDLTILGGLNEGTWPGEAMTDPWLSRPMRKTLGLEAPERRIGLAAHDFASLAAGPEVLLTRALKQDGAPSNASRWVLRLRQLARGLGLETKLEARNGLLSWARAIDVAAPVARAARPAPRPPVAARPRILRVTEIETWVRDPYAIYARHILKLRRLDPIDVEPGPRERGTAIHRALERFLLAYPERLPDNAFAELCRIGDQAFAESGASPAVMALWRPRFVRAVQWFLSFESDRRRSIGRALVEQNGELAIAGPAGPFTLRGRADRIDLKPDGTAAILDYKTGRVPTQKQMEVLLAPQLPLEAGMLMRGAFANAGTETVSELIHIRLTGGERPGEMLPYRGDVRAIAIEALVKLTTQIARYDDAAQPYRSRQRVERQSFAGDYDHLARVGEWALLGEEEE